MKIENIGILTLLGSGVFLIGSFFGFWVGTWHVDEVIEHTGPDITYIAENKSISQPSCLVDLINYERRRNNLRPLQVVEELNISSSIKAQDFEVYGYWGHVSPQGEEPWDIMDGVGYDHYMAGENLARDFKEEYKVVLGWLNSDKHRAVMLSPYYQHIGYGIHANKIVTHYGTLR